MSHRRDNIVEASFRDSKVIVQAIECAAAMRYGPGARSNLPSDVFLYDPEAEECCKICNQSIIALKTKQHFVHWALKLHAMTYAEKLVAGVGAEDFIKDWKAMDYIRMGPPEMLGQIAFTTSLTTANLCEQVPVIVHARRHRHAHCQVHSSQFVCHLCCFPCRSPLNVMRATTSIPLHPIAPRWHSGVQRNRPHLEQEPRLASSGQHQGPCSKIGFRAGCVRLRYLSFQTARFNS